MKVLDKYAEKETGLDSVKSGGIRIIHSVSHSDIKHMGQITPRIIGEETSTGFNDLMTHLPKPKNIIPVLNEDFQAEL